MRKSWLVRVGPQAAWDGHVSGTGATINLGAGGLYTYLFAKYDKPNYGSEVWYVGNLSGIIAIPATAGSVDLSGRTLFRGEVDSFRTATQQ